MSIIVAEVYEALIEAGVSESKARAAAAAIPAGAELAKQQDLAAVKQDLAAVKQDIAKLQSEVAVVKSAVFTFSPVIVALLVKLVFFP